MEQTNSIEGSELNAVFRKASQAAIASLNQAKQVMGTMLVVPAAQLSAFACACWTAKLTTHAQVLLLKSLENQAAGESFSSCHQQPGMNI